ncbi:TetR/AcrR family transcriptional regulator [Arthrobacter crusticola]|uniref:TetR/AcrR family transcriptional regulator n=1 Tax=Arthrobacter crusticola TaxID=2547960 RepID=A0A4R5TW29_9MICC|nr:TetR/AcrR family transcriptional regulator [Arthrobacter crusticola]TDK25288.1 TetR/AcrR family transcriptional regulator [Arthrobacter crusticola]
MSDGDSLLRLSGNDGERADAARNRRLLLEAAALIVELHGAENLTMDEVARHAGVGKGTLFRRFGNKTGLIHALLDQSGKDFQAAFMFGPPPLGPGAAPVDRLRAFGEASIRRCDFQGQLLRAAQEGPEALSHPTQRLARQHLGLLLREAGTTGDLELAAYELAAYLNAGLLIHLKEERRMPHERLLAGWHEMVERFLPR